ncbi:MAG: hypothetical protein HYU99_05780 [Deltaproteobacteria bacterium]|nr:hypothetical protein [Deltaproteobacteria bacterium]
MKTLFLKIILGTFLLLTTSCGSGGGESPSTEIPAPVSHLSASSPDSDGLIRVTAEAGFTDGGTTVTITNPSAVTNLWLDWLIPSAHAHATHTITSNADGSFQEEIEGAVGDRLEVTYTVDGAGASADVTVPANTPSLPATSNIQDVGIDPNTGTALVVANDGVDGFIHLIDLSDMSYESTIDLPGASGASRIATDPTTGDSIILDTENVTAIHITLSGGGSVVSTTGIIDSSDLSAGPSGDYVLIAHTDPTPALSFFDLASDSATAIGDSATEGGTAQESALFVASDFDGTDDMAGVVSLMPDSSFLLTTHIIDEIVPSITQDGAFPLDITSPGGIFVFSIGAEAFVTDSSTDLALRISLTDGSAVSIDVGDDPRGVAVNETGLTAYVVNNAGRTVSVISLTDDTVTSTEEVGLSPTEIAIGDVGGTATVIVINTGDETATIF